MLQKIESNISRKLEYNTYAKTIDLPAVAFEKYSSGEMINRVTYDADTLSFLFERILNVISSVIASFIVMIYILLNSWIIGLYIIFLVSILFLVIKIYNPKLKNIHKERKQEQDKFTSLTTETIRGIREIKTLGIKNKKDGIGDKLALWLKEEGFLSFDEDNGNYRDDSDMQAKAADMIDRALSGEKIYRIEDQEKAEQAENFDANMEAIREVFGNNVEQAEQTLRAIEDLQAKGYRVIGNSDVEYAEDESEKLMSFAEKEKQFKEKIEQLTKDKEELANIAQRRLIEIGRTATSASR